MKEYLVNPHILNQLHPVIIRKIESLSDNDKKDFIDFYTDSKKNIGYAYVFGILFGAHYGYLEKWGNQFALWFSILLFIGLIWWLIDLFRIKKLVKIYNDNLAVDIYNKVILHHLSHPSSVAEIYESTDTIPITGLIMWPICVVLSIYIVIKLSS